jgi:hypothetical protein
MRYVDGLFIVRLLVQRGLAAATSDCEISSSFRLTLRPTGHGCS